MAVYRLDSDMNGVDSISDYVADGRIVNLECPSFDAFDDYCIELQNKLQPGDTIIVDTVSAILNTTRGDRQLGNTAGEKLWRPDKLQKFFGDKEYLAVFNMAGQFVMRRLRNLRSRGARIIALTHESEAKESTVGISYKMAVPDVNPAMVGDLISASSDVFRLEALTEDVANNEGKIIFPEGTRVLRLRRKEGVFTAKFHVDRARSAGIPKSLPSPTIPKLWKTLGKQSTWLTIYGHPGAGKTSLAATAADVAAD